MIARLIFLGAAAFAAYRYISKSNQKHTQLASPPEPLKIEPEKAVSKKV